MTRPLPPGWAWTTLGEVGDVVTGTTPPKADASNYGDYIPLVKPPELRDTVLSSADDGLSEKGASRARVLPAGSVLVSCIGRLGLTALNTVPVAFNQQINAVVLPTSVESKYGFYYAQTLRNWLYSVASATTLPIVNKSRFEEVPFLLPPGPEQRRIVAKIEELFSQLDAGVEELKKAKAQLKRYRQSVLKAAFGGRLTSEWRLANSDKLEPAAKLLERIKAERKKVLGSKYKEPPLLDTSDLPELPEGWAWARLGDILADDLRNGRSVKTRDAGFPVLRLSAVRDGKVDLGDFKLGDWDMEDAEPFLVRDGDFLIARGNGSLHLVGRGGLVRNATRTVAYPDTLIRARVLPLTLDAAYLALVWESQLVRRHMERRARTTAGIYKISQPDIEQTIVPLPPVSEQCQIARQVEDVFSIADAEEKAIEAALKQAARLRQSILKRAFEGRLVPQDPSDEPATELLRRIREERLAMSEKRLVRRGKRPATSEKRRKRRGD